MKSLCLTGCLALLALAGCRTAPTYYWGNYEATTYSGYSKPGKLDLTAQASLLNEDLAHAERAHLRVNPGLHAQLGYVYVQMGRVGDAREQFIAEKTLFPESTVLMDRMIAKLEGPKQ
jgi:hypothetical protein